jgi:hypothetical protein
VLLLYSLVLLVMFALTWPSKVMLWQQGLSWALRVLLLLLTATWCCLTAFRTVGSLSRERQQQTLDGLLTLPVLHLTILRTIWMGGMMRFRHLGYAAAGCLVFGLVTGALHPLSVMLLSLDVAVALGLVASFGVWLGLVARSSLIAFTGMGLAMLVFLGGAWVAVLNSPGSTLLEDYPAAWENHLIQVGLNPLASWWLAGFSWADLDAALQEQDSLFLGRLQGILGGIGVLAVLACLFWSAAVRKLRALSQ